MLIFSACKFSNFFNSWCSDNIVGINKKNILNSIWCAFDYQEKCVSDIALLSGINITSSSLRQRRKIQILRKYVNLISNTSP